jgi:hypothetical protein
MFGLGIMIKLDATVLENGILMLMAVLKDVIHGKKFND